jgi:hypothetical protein
MGQLPWPLMARFCQRCLALLANTIDAMHKPAASSNRGATSHPY